MQERHQLAASQRISQFLGCNAVDPPTRCRRVADVTQRGKGKGGTLYRGIARYKCSYCSEICTVEITATVQPQYFQVVRARGYSGPRQLASGNLKLNCERWR
eukprot:633342-Rhodomonas_salina.2